MIEAVLTHNEATALVNAARHQTVDLGDLASGAAVLDEALDQAAAVEAHEADVARNDD
jgi:hypothetical protein